MTIHADHRPPRSRRAAAQEAARIGAFAPLARPRPRRAGLALMIGLATVAASCARLGFAQEAPASLELRVPCYSRAFTESALSEGWQQAPAGLGVSLEGALVELWTSAAGETWTLVLTRPDGWSCTLSAGEFWQVLRDESGV